MPARAEPFALLGGVVVFGVVALGAASSASAAAPARGGATSGALRVHAALERAKLWNDDRSFFVDVRVSAASVSRELPIDLVLALDVSGGTKERVALMSQALVEISDLLARGDRIAVVTFADAARTALSLDGARGEIATGAGVNVAAGLEEAASELRRSPRPHAARRIVLVTDGKPSQGVTSLEGLRAVAARLAGEGISVSTLGLGLGFDSALLAAISEAGGGRYNHVESAERVPAIYAAELRGLRSLVARGVRVRLEPAPGICLVDVVEHSVSSQASVALGDFEAGRSLNVVARLWAMDARRGAVLRVMIDGTDPTTGEPIGLEPVSLGAEVALTRDESSSSAILDVRPDVEDAVVTLNLERARTAARLGWKKEARATLAAVKRVRPSLEFIAPDGRHDSMSIDELAAELLAGLEEREEPAEAFALDRDGALDCRWLRNRSQAIAGLRTIGTSEAIFRSGDKEQDGNLDYGMLSELNNTRVVDSVIGCGTKQGYFFQTNYSFDTSEFLWFGLANPSAAGSTGDRSFASNQAGVIFYTTGSRFRSADKFLDNYLLPNSGVVTTGK
jgi:Ca-activated chloride channel family protein